MYLRFDRELSPTRFAELGKPSGAWRRADGGFAAIGSELDLLSWPGRAVYEGHVLRHRLSLYDGALETCIAVFDGARFPINDVAFHPTLPLVTVGTGRYDGGYMFEGDLWLWNWETNEVRRLLGESREVAQCRWVDDRRISVLLMPRYEDEYPGEENKAFETYVGLVIDDLRDVSESGFRSMGLDHDPRLADLQPIDPETLGFDTPPMHFRDRRPRFLDFLGTTAYEERARVWDLLWLSKDRLAAAHDQCNVEIWNTTTGARVREHKGEGFGVQLVEALGSPLVHVHYKRSFIDKVDARSTLFRLTPDGLEKLRAFDHAVVLSADASGNLLCRDTSRLTMKRDRADILLSAAGEELLAEDLGHYDCFNHYLRLDGGDSLFFLRGTPPSSHEGKYLYRLQLDGNVEEVMPWDQEAHLMNSVACWVNRASLARSYRVYNPRPDAGTNYIERTNLKYPTKPQWRLLVDAPATALHTVGHTIVYALTNGTIGLLDTETGESRWKTSLNVDGVPTFATALAPRDTNIAIGTIDGRVLLFELSTD